MIGRWQNAHLCFFYRNEKLFRILSNRQISINIKNYGTEINYNYYNDFFKQEKKQKKNLLSTEEIRMESRKRESKKKIHCLI